MVHKDERIRTSWFGPWVQPLPNGDKDSCEDSDERWDRERAFDIADSMEKGLAKELVTEFMHPLRRSSKLWRFNVSRSEDKLQHRLFSEDGDFLMYAKANLEAQRIRFFLYNPSEGEAALYDPDRPAFTMSFDETKSEWRLIQERCEYCRYLPRHLSCDSRGKQQVAFARHLRKAVGDGVVNCMEVNIPGLYSDGSRVIWCATNGMGDLATPPEKTKEAQRLTTRRPAWNNEVESLVLDFKGRAILASAKNFQLSLRQKPDHVICQFGKVGPNTFGLDFKYPMSVIQAFGVSMTTLFWR
eukprot:gnl/TRDRNA2_/TRDRNA2_196563_c0_seq1.p1 gnl/TRDRNA2_/TRDRNA2_196563_c0~~gnl/TRDRNA2_/TRDRNA2_196563_c0_seq1.p1  ORF type:complete len:299 (+),score=48.47 gnl/TRDRNA2_/TRDRNA2_196563_c0_seq1:96-992(+)